MKLSIFVHDFHLEIGHSNAMIELIRGMDLSKIDEITVISFTSSKLDIIFPQFKGKLKHRKVPFSRIRPVLLKEIFFQCYSYLLTIMTISKGNLKIGIGTCILHADLVNVQFIHSQWAETYLSMQKGRGLIYLYKVILYKYFSLCENYLFKKKKIYFISLSKFITKYMIDHFGVSKENIKTIYSGINLDRFKIPEKSWAEIFEQLQDRYPQIQGLDLSLPIFLFAGAFERKGLPQALEVLARKGQSTQLIAIGQSEFKQKISIPENVNLFIVKFTKELDLFYALSDCFIFPTLYEPFGLVIIEAVAMGLDVLIPKLNTGASELLTDMPGIYLINDFNLFDIEMIQIVSLSDKKIKRRMRLERLDKLQWHHSSKIFEEFLSTIGRTNSI